MLISVMGLVATTVDSADLGHFIKEESLLDSTGAGLEITPLIFQMEKLRSKEGKRQ